MAFHNNMQRGPAPPLYGGGPRMNFGQVPRGVPGRMPSPTPSAMRGRGIGIGPGGGSPLMGGSPPMPMEGPTGGGPPQDLNRMGPQGMSGESQTRNPFEELFSWLNDVPYGTMMRTGNVQAPYDQPKGGGPGGGGPQMPIGDRGQMGRPSRPLYSPPGGGQQPMGGGRPPMGGGQPPMGRPFSQPTPGGGAPYSFDQFAGGGGQQPLYQPQQFGGMPPMPRGY
jgi:hypothetical protein